MNILGKLFGKKQNLEDEIWIKKSLLQSLLENKPADTQAKIINGFANVTCNYEFAVSVVPANAQQCADEASARGFIVWVNRDAIKKTVIMYGAGPIHESSFSDCMVWLTRIRAPGDVALVHFMGNDGDKIITLQ